MPFSRSFQTRCFNTYLNRPENFHSWTVKHLTFTNTQQSVWFWHFFFLLLLLVTRKTRACYEIGPGWYWKLKPRDQQVSYVILAWKINSPGFFLNIEVLMVRNREIQKKINRKSARHCTRNNLGAFSITKITFRVDGFVFFFFLSLCAARRLNEPKCSQIKMTCQNLKNVFQVKKNLATALRHLKMGGSILLMIHAE